MPLQPATSLTRPVLARPVLTRPWRRGLVAVHVVVSVGWLGVALVVLVLAVAGRTAPDGVTRRSAYVALDVVADALVAPLAAATLVTGVLLGLLTPWGLFRHLWVTVKLALTVVAAGLSVTLLAGHVDTAREAVMAVDAGEPAQVLARAGLSLVSAGAVSLTLYLVATVLSVVKPWGRTPWARPRRAPGRDRHSER